MDSRTTNDIRWNRYLGACTGAALVLAVASAAAQDAPAKPAQAQPHAAVQPEKGAGAHETFTVQFQDTNVLQALQMLAMQGNRNIIPSKGITGTITANLFDVTIMEALDVVLRANDLRMEELGNFIYVYTAAEWDMIATSRLKRTSRNFSLQYLNAKDASEFIKPLLSDQGKASFVGDAEKGFQATATDGGADGWAFQGMLVVSDLPDNIKAIEKLLAEIDTPPAQVVVEATVVSSKVEQADGFGVDISVIGNLDFNQLTAPLSGANNLFLGDSDGGVQPANNKGTAVNSAVSGWDRPATMRVGVLSSDVAVFLRLLDSVTDTTVLARPRIMALNRQRAQILIGRRVGYLTSTTTQTATTQSVEFLDSGIKLIFRPFISNDGSIRMELAPSVSDAKVEQLTTTGGATQSVPNEDTSEIVTNIRVKDGQTLVLGGLFKEDTKIERRQVPGLGEIPLIGNAFKGFDDSLKREEIIFLITPSIVKDQIAKVWADEANEFASAVRIGAREGLLPLSREALTTAQNQAAFDALAKGDRALALHHVENSLRMSRNQPEMIRLREELKGRESVESIDFERSMMRRMIKAGAKRTEAAAQQPEAAQQATKQVAQQPGVPAAAPSAAPAAAPATAPASDPGSGPLAEAMGPPSPADLSQPEPAAQSNAGPESPTTPE